MTAEGHTEMPDRDEVLHLYDSQRTVVKDELSSAFQYLSFYVGLIAAILGATLAGFLHMDKGDWRGLALLAGPLMTVVLGWLGYHTVDVFYRRFSEAWVSNENLAARLGWYRVESWTPLTFPYPSSLGGGPLARPILPAIRQVFDRAEADHWSAERLAGEIHDLSPTLRYALFTFVGYAAIGLALAVLIVGRALQSPAQGNSTSLETRCAVQRVGLGLSAGVCERSTLGVFETAHARRRLRWEWTSSA